MRFFGFLYAASLLLSSFCPMSMASAMQASSQAHPLVETQDGFMSPSMPMTFAAPMSVAAVVTHRTFSPTAQALDGYCPGGNCIMTDHSQTQEIVVPAASGDIQGEAAFSAAIRSIVASLSEPPQPSLHTGGPHLANTISTIVLRV